MVELKLRIPVEIARGEKLSINWQFEFTGRDETCGGCGNTWRIADLPDEDLKAFYARVMETLAIRLEGADLSAGLWRGVCEGLRNELDPADLVSGKKERPVDADPPEEEPW
ncbi:MAG TPA: hypothetical protein VFG76_12745 [Candidatus Polarisedimenticolia bacterium]|nr:hypothetical protein [Candidatus Polarisedimenticolia bacterium]